MVSGAYAQQHAPTPAGGYWLDLTATPPTWRATSATYPLPAASTLAAETTKVIGTVNQGTSPWIAAGGGTAGSAASGVVTVQGIASMTKLLVTPDSVALPANQSVNLAQIAGATTPVGSGVMATAQLIALATDSPGIVTLGQTTKSASVPVTIASDQYVDPCQSPNIAKSSVAIGITSATTTALVTVSGATTVYVCGYDFTISQVITTANTLVFEGGTGTACAAAVVANTGTFGAGGVTVGPPLHVSYNPGMTAFKTAASSGLCALTAIGGSGSFQGVLTYVQQ